MGERAGTWVIAQGHGNRLNVLVTNRRPCFESVETRSTLDRCRFISFPVGIRYLATRICMRHSPLTKLFLNIYIHIQL